MTSSNDVIDAYDESLAYKGNWALASANGDPQDVVAADTCVYVLDSTAKQVFRYPYVSSTATASMSLRNTTGGTLGNLRGMAIDGDELWVADQSNNRLLVYSLAAAFSGSGTISATKQFTQASGNTGTQALALDATYVYALDQSDRVFYRYPRTTANGATGVATVSGTMRNASGSNLSNLSGAVLENGTMWVINSAWLLVYINSVHSFTLANLFSTTGNVNAASTTTPSSASGSLTGIGLNHLPSVTAITRAVADPTNTATVTFTVAFSEAVTGVAASDFQLVTTGGIASATVASTGADSGSTRLVTVNTGTGSGTIQLNFVDDDLVVDSGYQPLGGEGLGNGSFTGPAYTIDKVPPTSTLSGPASPTNANPLNFTVNFSKSVSGLSAAGLTLTGGSIGTITGSGTGPYTVPITPTGQGTISCQVKANAASDAAGNGNVVSGTVNVIYDSLAPAINSINRQNPASATTNDATVTWRVVFNEPVDSATLQTADFALTAVSGAISGASILSVDPVNATTCDVTAGTGSGDGILRLDIPAAADISDLVGNSYHGVTTGGQSYTIDKTPPGVSLASTAGGFTNAAFTVTAAFSEPITNFSSGDVTVGNGVVNNFTEDSPSHFTWTIIPAGQGLVSVSISAGAVTDEAANPNTASNHLSTTYDSMTPSCTVTGPASPNKTSPINFTITFSEPVSGLTVADITVGNGTKGSLSGSGTGPYTLAVTPAAQGAVTCQVKAGSAQDAAGNSNTISNQFNIMYDSIAPSCTVWGPASPTKTSPINFTITFSESVTGLTAADITVVNGTKGALSGSGAGPYTMPVTPTAQGAVTCQVNAGAAQDAAGNSNATSNLLSITYDSVAPSCTVTGPASPTKTSPINFTINFSESVTGLTASDITVGNGTKGALSGSGAGPYTMPVVPTAQGSVTCQLSANAAQDAAGNSSTLSNNLSITYDSVAPTCTVTGPVSPTKTNPINFTINFSEPVFGLDAADIMVVNGTKGALSGSGAGPYTMPVTPTAQGAVTCQVTADAAQDAAGNSITISNLLSVTYDSVAPTCTVSGPASPAKNSPINFTITFSEPVSGLAAAGITIMNGTKGALSGSGAGPYIVPVTPTAQGAVTCQVNAGAAQDAAGNSSAISNLLSIIYDSVAPSCTVTGPASPAKTSPIKFTITFSESVTGLTEADITVTGGSKGILAGTGAGPYTMPVTPTAQGAITCQVNAGAAQDAAGNSNATSNLLSITYDSVAPTCTVTGPASPTKNSPINFTITFSEPVTGLTEADITVTGGGKGILAGTGVGPYTLPVTPTAQGAVTCQVNAGAAQDAAGNSNTISNLLGVTYDSVAPSCTVTGPASPTKTSPINFTINFSESVTGLTAADITVVNATKGALTGSGTGPYTLPVTPTTQGVVKCQVIAGAAQDAAGNSSDIANLLSITYDSVAPTCAVTGPVSPTKNSPINFTITFNEPVSGLAAGGITIVNGTKGALSGSGAGPYTLPVTPSAQGAVICQVSAGAAQDAAGNSNAASNQLSMTYDSVAPSCAVMGPASPTKTSPINFTITFSEPVTGLTEADITVTGGSKGILAGSGAGPYTLPVTPSAQGSVTCQVSAGAAQDAAGNSNAASNLLSITYDSVAPSCTVTGPASPTKSSPINFTITFTESVTGLTASDITVGNGTKGALSGSGAGPYTLPVTPGAQGTVTCQVNAGGAQDAAGNVNVVSNISSVDYDAPPSGTVTGPASPTNASSIVFTINFSEPVAGLSMTDIAVDNGIGGNLIGSGAGPYTLAVIPSDQGAVTCQVMAGAVQDATGNSNAISNLSSIIYDSVAPACTVDAPASPTNANPMRFTINFNEPVTGLAAAGITVGNGIQGALSGSGAGPYTLPVTPGAQGAVTCQVSAGAAQDAAGNLNSASNTTSTSYDLIAPSVMVSGPISPTNLNPIVFNITMSKPVTNLTMADITVTGATPKSLTGSGDGPYMLSVTPNGQGQITCQVKAGACQDVAGNFNVDSNSFGVDFDSNGPTCTIEGPASPTSTIPIQFTITFNEAVQSLALADITVTSGTADALSGGGVGPYTLTVSPCSETLRCQIKAGKILDIAGNPNKASSIKTVVLDSALRFISINPPSLASTTTGPVDFTVNYIGESDIHLTAADVTLNATRTAKGTISVFNGKTAHPTVRLSNITGYGTLGISLAPGTASDSAGKSSGGAGPSKTFSVIDPNHKSAAKNWLRYE